MSDNNWDHGGTADSGTRPRNITPFISGAAIGLFLVLNTIFWGALYFDGMVTTKENGLIENCQAGLIGVSGLIFLAGALGRYDPREKIFFGGWFLLCLSFLLREMDIETYNLHPALIWIGSGFGRNLLLSAMWATGIVFFLGHWRTLTLMLLEWLRHPAGVLALLAGSFLLLSLPFEHDVFAVNAATLEFGEEILEINACLLLFFSTLYGASKGFGVLFATPR